jgi:hypothetical protein
MPDLVTIVAACTSSKAQVPSEALRLRSLPHSDLNERFERWTRRIAQDPSTTPAGDLYRGQHWARVCDAVNLLKLRGQDVQPLAASAGLGLIEFETRIPSYSATFSSGPDSVWRGNIVDGDRSAAQSAWWKNLRDSNEKQAKARGKTIVIACSPHYLDALQDDVRSWVEEGRNVILLSTTFESEHTVHFDQRLAGLVPCAMSAINGAALLFFVRTADQHRWKTAQMRSVVQDALDGVPAQRANRRRACDGEIETAIREMLEHDVNASATHMLAALRAAGVSCEQARFRKLLHNVASR